MLVACLVANAHPIRPDVVTVEFDDSGHYTVEIRTNLEAWLAGIGPQHQESRDAPQAAQYDALRELSPNAINQAVREARATLLDALIPAFDGRRAEPAIATVNVPEVGDTGFARLSTLVLRGKIPSNARQFTWAMSDARGNNVIRIRNSDGTIAASQWLTSGATSDPYFVEHTVATSFLAVAVNYTVVGFTHIVPLGLDHILFVLGIFLLSHRMAPLLWQVTAFTIAHSITLGLSMYGVVSLSPAIVEPLIALSIVYVGVENILTRTLKPWRVVIVFGFGLLHGLGFAGVLTEIGIPESDFITALVTFNVGVELGQLAVILGAWLLVAAWFRHKDWYRYRVVIPGSLAISLVGAYWTLERTFG